MDAARALARFERDDPTESPVRDATSVAWLAERIQSYKLAASH
jgi:hypothetical protein